MHRRLAAAAALVTLLAGGCGIPEDSGVTVVGPGPTSGAAVGDDGVPPARYTREAANDPAQLVEYYLEAAAGDPEGAPARVKAFLAPDAAERFQPGSGSGAADVRVVRMVDRPLYTPGDPEITVRLQQVGTLRSSGVLEPTPDPTPAAIEERLRVGQLPGRNGLFITRAPPVLLLTDTALKDFYLRRTIYFWDNDYTGLVPDVRYMPRSLPTVQQPTTILSWLVDGPASWLSKAVQPLPPGTAAPDNVPAITNGTLQINLSAQAVPPGNGQALDRLRRQLQWSLRPLLPSALELRIGHQDPVRYTDQDYLTSNVASQLVDVPERFVIYNGVIRRLVDAPEAVEPVPVLKAADNRGIVAAAMSATTTHAFAAVVVGWGQNQRLRVGMAGRGATADLKDVGGLSGTLGRPVWALAAAGGGRARAIGLITVNGRLHSFAADGSRARPVEWQGEPGRVTAVSVAPDGHRVALVSGGKLYRTVLDTSDDTFALSAPEQVLPPTFSTVAAVSWSSEGWLTAAGVLSENGRISILDVSVDGALQMPRLPDIGDKTVSYLTTYPTNPVTDRENSDSVSYTAAGSAWDVLSTAVLINTADLFGPAGNAPPGTKPTAPFFLD